MHGVEELIERHEFLHDVVDRAGGADDIAHGQPAVADGPLSGQKTRPRLDLQMGEDVANRVEIGGPPDGVFREPGDGYYRRARSACDVQDGVCVTPVLFQFFDCFNRRQEQELDLGAWLFASLPP